MHCWASDSLFLPLGPNGLFLTIHSQFLVALIIGLFFPLGFPQMALNNEDMLCECIGQMGAGKYLRESCYHRIECSAANFLTALMRK